ncbi:hypothetical protein RDWZM_003595 [Blomia tropicalis]|uniref:Uncharacterized protein n=1 Tax=Blomia tropicalis TaxID=40697 RepID=A0A9Q0MJT2_BLOTA|nr:hypothetical protein RDWZM_003595 [Blomia tropicalis]
MVEWQRGSNGFVSDDAVIGGNDVNGERIFVGRVHHGGDLIPGKIVPSHGVLYVPYAGDEHSHREYEFLVKPNYGDYMWTNTADGDVPGNAVMGGNTSDGENLFIGRAFYEGSWVVGKVHPSHRVLYVPFGGKEVSISDYEILCVRYD